MIPAAIVGGSGYGGMELLRLLLAHPEIEVVALGSRSRTGRVDALHPHLRGFTDLSFSDRAPEDLAADSDLLFFAAPAGVAAAHVPACLARNDALRVVDLSADFRLGSGEEYARVYGEEHPAPALLGRVPYGLPECGRREEIAGARLVANPGCHAAAAALAVWPFLAAGLVAGRVAIASVTGSSGAGASPGAGTHHPERFGNFKAYDPLRHRHAPEIERALRGDVQVDFVPHSGPFARGIHCTAFVPLPPGREAEARAALDNAWRGEPFVRRLDGPPEVRAVTGSDLADVWAHVGDALAVSLVVLDNLGKGMAAQAVQNANLMLGLDETAGLLRPGVGP